MLELETFRHLALHILEPFDRSRRYSNGFLALPSGPREGIPGKGASQSRNKTALPLQDARQQTRREPGTILRCQMLIRTGSDWIASGGEKNQARRE